MWVFSVFRVLGAACLAVLLLFTMQMSFASTGDVSVISGQPAIFDSDFGGSIKERLTQIEQLKKNKQAIEIRGKYCLSSCTMLLVLDDICISKETLFGFHGPSSKLPGVGLPPGDYEHWSNVLASHYPEPIRSWYLREGRKKTNGFHFISGLDLINLLNLPACSDISP